MFGGNDNDNPGGGVVQPTGSGSPMDGPAADNPVPANPTYDEPADNYGGQTDAPSQTDYTSAPAADTDDLVAIKQQALQQLTPLVSHLEQTPEEKFRTTMMLIQASDNKELLKEAYEAAQGIDDEKARAQALLDVINEINYFTQSNKQPDGT